MTYDAVRKIGLALPGVVEGTSYGTPALKVKGKLFVRLRPDLEAIVIATPFEQREELMASDPEKYFITDHYRDYPYMLVRLSKVGADEVRDLLRMAHRTASAGKPFPRLKPGHC
jgi:hypothetical protein